MSLSSNWLRVAAGLKMVATAAAARSSKQTTIVASRAAQHGFDVLANATRVAKVELPQQSNVSKTHNGIPPQPKDKGNDQWQEETQRDHLHASSTVIINGYHSNNKDPFMTTEIPHTEPDIRGGYYNKGVSVENDTTTDTVAALGSALKDEKAVTTKRVVNGSSKSSLRLLKENKDEKIKSSVENQSKELVMDKEADHESLPKPQTKKPVSNSAATPSPLFKETYSKRLEQGRAVPSTRVGRAAGFAGLGLGLALGTAAEFGSRLLLGGGGSSYNSSVVANNANADRLAASLCRMRGAALKLGQMLSIQDETLLPPALSRAMAKVRQGAESMPRRQLLSQLETQLGTDWRSKLDDFEERPFAAASLGQVHRAKVGDRRVVLKVQYPGVADSIDSDLDNVQMLVEWTGMAPPGLFLDNVIRVGRTELKQECNYKREAQNQTRFRQLVQNDAILRENKFVVPRVVEELTTDQILTSDHAPGGTIDKVSHLDQDERNRIARNILRLTMQELFVWRFMQTDPNWGNFLYDVHTGTTHLIDFGAARDYSREFVDGYLRIVWAAANTDGDTIMDQSHRMGFLTGDENEIMREAHKASGFTVGEPFRSHEPFDFRGSNISSRLSRESSAFLQHRLTPPPEEVYTLHRKLAGAYMLCIKLGAVINCREMLEEIMDNHVFQDEQPAPVDYNMDTDMAARQALTTDNVADESIATSLRQA